jgi:hypothetical protein
MAVYTTSFNEPGHTFVTVSEYICWLGRGCDGEEAVHLQIKCDTEAEARLTVELEAPHPGEDRECFLQRHTFEPTGKYLKERERLEITRTCYCGFHAKSDGHRNAHIAEMLAAELETILAEVRGSVG